MASPRASRWPPPLLLLLLPLLLPPPAAPGTRGPPSSPALLPGAGPPSPPRPGHAAPGPGAATRRGRSGRASGGASAAAARNYWPESSNTDSHMGNTPFYQSQENHPAVSSGKGVTVQTPGVSHTSSEVLESLSLLPKTASAEGKHESSSRKKVTILPVGHSPVITTALTSQGSSLASERLPLSSTSSRSGGKMAHSQTESRTFPGFLEKERGLPEEEAVHTQVADTSVSSQSSLPALELREPSMPSRKRNSLGQEHSENLTHPPSDHPSSSGNIKKYNNSTALQSPSITQTQSSHLASPFTNGAPRMLRSLTVSMEPINETESFSEGSKTATVSASVHSSSTVVDSRTNSRLTENPGDVIEPSIENEFGLTSLDWQSDSPTFGQHQLASSSEAENESFVPQTETVFRSVPSLGDGESTAHWSLANNKTPADVTESSALHQEVVSTSVLTWFLDSAQQPGVGGAKLGERTYSESSPTSSSESPNSSAPQGGFNAFNLRREAEEGRSLSSKSAWFTQGVLGHQGSCLNCQKTVPMFWNEPLAETQPSHGQGREGSQAKSGDSGIPQPGHLVEPNLPSVQGHS